jgi:hypothetical protein
MHIFDYIAIGTALACAVSLVAAYAFGSLTGGKRREVTCGKEGTRLIARIVFDIDICKGLPETVPATGSRRKSRDHRRPRSGRILPPCDIGSSSTRLRLGFLRTHQGASP